MALPLPSPRSEPEEGWIVGGLKHLNALSKQSLENQYYGPMMQADMASKNAYAQWLPAQLMAQAISSPGFATLDKNQQKIMLDKYHAALNNPPPANNAPPQSGGALNALMGLFNSGGQQQSPQNAMIQSPDGFNQVKNVNAVQNPGDYYTQPMEAQGAPPKPPAQGGYNTPAGQEDAGQLMPGSNPISPLAAAENQQAAEKEAVVGQTNNQNAEQKLKNEQSNAISSAAIDARKALDMFHTNYIKSSYIGPRLGAKPSSGEGSIPTLPGGTMGPEQLADTGTQQFLEAVTRMQGGGHLTDDARELLSSAKGFGRHLERDAEEKLYESTNAKLERLENSNNFRNDFFHRNPRATEEDVTAMMNNFNRFAPSYDYKKSEAMPENEDKFRDFTSPEALAAYKRDGKYNPYTKKNMQKEAKKISQPKAEEGPITKSMHFDGKEFAFINGVWHEKVR